MLDNIKKLSVPAYLLFGGAVLSLVALIVAIISCTGEGFGMEELPIVAILTVAAVALCVGVVFVAGKMGDNVLASVMVFAMVIALTFCVYFMIMGKSDVFGTVIFSDLEKGYAPAEQACWLGVVSIVMYMVASVATAVGAFFKLSKTK